MSEHNIRVSCQNLIVVLLLASLTGCATNPYLKARTQFQQGAPDEAVQTMLPLAQPEIDKDGKNKNVYLWDLGIYEFYQGNYTRAREYFLQSVRDKEQINTAGDDIKAALSSSASSKYVGDPVEISMAYYFLGLCFMFENDAENALVAFRRSLEEDLNDDADKIGDLVIVHYTMGQLFLDINRLDDATVAFQNCLAFNERFMPAKIELAVLWEQSRPEDAARLWEEIQGDKGAEFVMLAKKNGRSGVILVIADGFASQVRSDRWVGAFRRRSVTAPRVGEFRIRCVDSGQLITRSSVADNMHYHLTTQGGFGQELQSQATRLVASTAMRQVPILGWFAPKVEADVRYWHTLPNVFYVVNLPVAEGEHAFEIEATCPKGNVIPQLSWRRSEIMVSQNRRKLIALSAFTR